MIDRGDAVNLANNIIENNMSSGDITTKGIHYLANDVLRMDAALLDTFQSSTNCANDNKYMKDGVL